MGMKEWSKQPGAAKYITIIQRLRHGWEPERAVFARVDRSRIRRVGVNRESRGLGYLFVKRRPARLKSNPRRPNPHPPTWGGFSSYPIEALPILRRVA